MFYLMVEEYVMQNRWRELAKELELKHQIRDVLESKSDIGLHFIPEFGDQLRNLTRIFRADASESIDDRTPLVCVVC